MPVGLSGAPNGRPGRLCLWGTKNQPETFQTKVLSWTSARDVCAKSFFFKILEGLTKFLAGYPQGYPGQNFLFGLISDVKDTYF